jgi:hypothetical protein
MSTRAFGSSSHYVRADRRRAVFDRLLATRLAERRGTERDRNACTGWRRLRTCPDRCWSESRISPAIAAVVVLAARRRSTPKQHDFARELLGLEAPTARWQRTPGSDALINTLSNASDVRAQVITLALVLSAFEATLGVHTWRNSNASAARYFTQIATWGYELSEIEQFVIKNDSEGG